MASKLSEYAISASEYLAQNGQYDRVVIGVAIFDANGRLLVVQRAAHESSFANMYELPGGHVEDSDGTILDAVVRETKEETGLDVSSIDSTFAPFDYRTHETAGLSHQLNFRVRVKADAPVTLAPDEHQAFQWISMSDTEQLLTTETMRKTIRDALATR
ncbi:NUDIX hydrolase domain-like protein [Gongronella butleri]|nr:NUDIX hydrolase domain-like protein [Gongronella butleri]